MKVLLSTLILITLSGCEMMRSSGSDDRSMKLEIKHSCLHNGSLEVNANGSNEQEANTSETKVNIPVP